MGFQFKEEVNVFIWTLLCHLMLVPFDASMIFIKERTLMLLRISTLSNLTEKRQRASKTEQGFYSVRNASSPSQSHLTKNWTFPRGLFPVMPQRCCPTHLPYPHAFLWGKNSKLSLSLPAINCPLVSSTLSHPEPLVGRGMHSISTSRGKGNTVHFPLLPSSHCQSTAAMKGCTER